jgi:hypothetical protein
MAGNKSFNYRPSMLVPIPLEDQLSHGTFGVKIIIKQVVWFKIVC